MHKNTTREASWNTTAPNPRWCYS